MFTAIKVLACLYVATVFARAYAIIAASITFRTPFHWSSRHTATQIKSDASDASSFLPRHGAPMKYAFSIASLRL